MKGVFDDMMMCDYLYINTRFRSEHVLQVVCECQVLKLQSIRAMSRLIDEEIRSNKLSLTRIHPVEFISGGYPVPLHSQESGNPPVKNMDWVLVRAHETTEPIPRTVVRRIKRASKTSLCIVPVSSIASQSICRNREYVPASISVCYVPLLCEKTFQGLTQVAHGHFASRANDKNA